MNLIYEKKRVIENIHGPWYPDTVDITKVFEDGDEIVLKNSLRACGNSRVVEKRYSEERARELNIVN